MYYLAIVFPKLREIRLPFTRDQFFLLLVAVNEIILGLDIFLAHSISGTIVPYEWIPIIFGPVAGVVLLAAGLIAQRNRERATNLATIVFLASILVGVLGSYFHIRRAFPLEAQLTDMLNLELMIWAPPLFGPITFAGVGLLGMIAAWRETTADSGELQVTQQLRLKLPYPKTNIYIFLVALGTLAALLSSVLDHARTGFENPWLWLPTLAGVFAVITAVALGNAAENIRNEASTYIIAMILMIAVGLIGAVLHIQHDLTADFQIVQERFLRGAPFMAPLNFANMALLGLLALLDPQENRE